MAGGLACVTKFSMVVAGPILAAIFLLMIWRAPWYKHPLSALQLVNWRASKHKHPRLMIAGQACVAALACIIIINAAYFFSHRGLLDGDIGIITAHFSSNPLIALTAVTALSKLLPAYFMTGIIYQGLHAGFGHYGFTASLLGMYSDSGWLYYFPVAFALKTTIPFLLLSIASLGWCGYRAFMRHDRRCRLLLTAFAVYSVSTMLSSINIGIRYFLPAYPLLFIMGGAVLDLLIRSQRSRAAAIATAAALLLWTATEAVYAYPNYMSYMNQLTYGRPHWQYLSDSNVEWGDDAKELVEYLRARGEDRVQTALIGSVGDLTLKLYGITNIDLMREIAGPLSKPRYVAIGASFLNGSSVPDVVRGKTLTKNERLNFFDAYRQRKPTDIIGGSIYVFRDDE